MRRHLERAFLVAVVTFFSLTLASYYTYTRLVWDCLGGGSTNAPPLPTWCTVLGLWLPDLLLFIAVFSFASALILGFIWFAVAAAEPPQLPKTGAK